MLVVGNVEDVFLPMASDLLVIEPQDAAANLTTGRRGVNDNLSWNDSNVGKP